MRSHYWTIGKFADWVRGTPKLECGTSDQWDEWTRKAQGESPLRYWLAEEGLDILQKIVFYPTDTLYAIKYYINNRFVTRTHALTAHPRNIKPGEWCDVGNRFLPCLFNELQDFVEVELAWWHIAWDDEARKKFKAPWYARGWFRWRTWRNKECGLANLEWQRKLTCGEDWGVAPDHKDFGKPTQQAVKAQEILDLYTWWTEVYPNRVDAHEASGWSAYCDAKRDLNDGRLFGSKETPELKKEGNKALKLSSKIEAQYEKEDTDMMIRLIKVRHGLWT